MLYAKCMSEEWLAGRLTSDDESEAGVLCDRNAGRTTSTSGIAISPIDAIPDKGHPKNEWLGQDYPPNESRHSNAFGSSLFTRGKGCLFAKTWSKRDCTLVIRTAVPSCIS
jgi:hypothetical protein